MNPDPGPKLLFTSLRRLLLPPSLLTSQPKSAGDDSLENWTLPGTGCPPLIDVWASGKGPKPGEGEPWGLAAGGPAGQAC